MTAQPAAVPCWREHFYEIRRWFFGINLALLIHVALSGVFLIGVPLLAVSWLPVAVAVVLNLFGILSASPRLHAALAVIALATNVLGFGAVWFQPGWPRGSAQRTRPGARGRGATLRFDTEH